MFLLISNQSSINSPSATPSSKPSDEPSAAPSLSPSESPTSNPTLSPTLSLCTISEGYSDGSLGDLVADQNGELMLGGVPLASQYSATSGTIGTAFDATTTFDNVDHFVVPAGVTVNVLGKVIVRANRITIDGTLDGSEGGYPGGASGPTGYQRYAAFGESPPNSNGEGGGGIYNSGGRTGGGGGGHGKSTFFHCHCSLILILILNICFVVKCLHTYFN